MQAINMSCPVSPAAVVNSSEGYIWEWLKLAPGSSEELIVDGITSGSLLIWFHCMENMMHFFLSAERDISVYNLQIQCASGGIYQALYYNAADNDTCLFGCFFPVQVEETDIDVLREEFETYREPQINRLALYDVKNLCYSCGREWNGSLHPK